VNGDNLTGQVWVGGGLVRHMPMSPERAAQQAREDEREARQAAFEAELRGGPGVGTPPGPRDGGCRAEDPV